jgi:hypothetical protein
MYLSYPRYQDLGGKLNEQLFVRAEMTARMKIDQLTFNRLQSLSDDHPIWEKVEFLMFELIERGYLGKLNGEDTTSESNDGRSVTWANKEGKADEFIKTYLSSLFRIIQVGVLRV